MAQRIKWLGFLILCMGMTWLACLVAPQTANASVILATDPMWGTTANPWQTNPKMTNPGGIYKMTGTTISEGSYNYQFTYTGHLSDLVNFVAGTTTPALSKLSTHIYLPNLNLAQGQPNYDSSVVPQVTVADGTNISTSTKFTDVGLDDNKLSAANYYTRIEFTSGVMPAFNPGLSNLNDVVTITFKVKLSQPSNAGTAQVKINNSLAVIPVVSKAFYKDDVTGADLAPAVSFGEGGVLGAPVKQATALPITDYGGTKYRYDHYQKIVKEGTSLNPYSGSNSTSLPGIPSVDLTSKTLNSYVFWYEPKDTNITVNYVNQSGTIMKTEKAWAYNLGHIYKNGTTEEIDANLVTPADTVTYSGKTYQYTDYSYTGDETDENAKTESGTDIAQLKKLTTQVGATAGHQVLTFGYNVVTKTNVGVHYWDIDQQPTTVPTGSEMDADKATTNPTGLGFTKLSGDKDTPITGGTTDPIDVDGSGGVAAAKAPAGWYYVGYQYNDGSGSNKWVAYDPKTPSTSRFTGKFSAKDQGVSFMYRRVSALAMVLPATLDFGTVVPGVTSTNLKTTTGANANADSLQVKVKDDRQATTPTNQWTDPWYLTVSGATLTATKNQTAVAGASISLTDGAIQVPTTGVDLASDFTLPLDGTLQMVLTSTTAPGGSSPTASWANADVALNLPTTTTVAPGEYHSTLTWTLTSGY
ncbi:WxL domain-containing protein [Loigolactobacillus zhaoyuanensis]|uniref:WxL domain-containing protein n=1 Tax=Loigolactobacillus zhaoyuanensis TaxID=2486017 RepID=UPI0013DE40F1|nr:WxL domain-containing protein [Loigolactobacillus zhaoyuanensis]